jgi:hypothetical protein
VPGRLQANQHLLTAVNCFTMLPLKTSGGLGVLWGRISPMAMTILKDPVALFTEALFPGGCGDDYYNGGLWWGCKVTVRTKGRHHDNAIRNGFSRQLEQKDSVLILSLGKLQYSLDSDKLNTNFRHLALISVSSRHLIYQHCYYFDPFTLTKIRTIERTQPTFFPQNTASCTRSLGQLRMASPASNPPHHTVHCR